MRALRIVGTVLLVVVVVAMFFEVARLSYHVAQCEEAVMITHKENVYLREQVEGLRKLIREQ